MTKIISMFNHKGGVSKTTTAFNLGWMLANQGHRVVLVDADPQCNLTGMSLGLSGPMPDAEEDGETTDEATQVFADAQARAKAFFEDNLDRTLYGALRPAFESEPRSLEPVECLPLGDTGRLFLLPGHLRLGEYEVTLSVAQEMSGSITAMKNIPGSIHFLLTKTAEELDADFVIVDMSPSLGALNQNLTVTSDLLFVPSSPDYYSIMALHSLARILPRWMRWAEQAAASEVLQTAAYPFPAPTMKVAGTVIQRYRLYRRPTADNPHGDPTRPFQEWINRVCDAMTSDFVPAMEEAGLLLQAEAYERANIDRSLVLARIQEFNSLLPKSQEHQVPVFELTDEQLGQHGVVLDGSHLQIHSLHSIFSDLAAKISTLASFE